MCLSNAMKDENVIRSELWRALTTKSPVVKEKPVKETEQAARRVAIQSRQRKVSQVKGEKFPERWNAPEKIRSILWRLRNWQWSHDGFSESISVQSDGGKKPNAPVWEVNWTWGNKRSEQNVVLSRHLTVKESRERERFGSSLGKIVRSWWFFVFILALISEWSILKYHCSQRRISQRAGGDGSSRAQPTAIMSRWRHKWWG